MITTIEFDSIAADQAKINFHNVGPQNTVHLLRGAAMKPVTAFGDQEFDLVFQDADKATVSTAVKKLYQNSYAMRNSDRR